MPKPVKAEFVEHAFHPDDGIVHRAVDPATGTVHPEWKRYADIEHAAVQRALVNEGMWYTGEDAVKKRKTYVSLIRRLFDHPSMRGLPGVRRYVDAARLMNDPAEEGAPVGLLAARVQPFVRMVRDTLQRRYPGERVALPGNKTRVHGPAHVPTLLDQAREPDEPPYEVMDKGDIRGDQTDATAVRPASGRTHKPLALVGEKLPNRHQVIENLFSGGSTREHVVSYLMNVYNLTRRSALSALRSFAHAREAKRGLTKLARKAGDLVSDTSLAYHLFRIAKTHGGEIARHALRALNPDAVEGTGEPYAALGRALKKAKSADAALYNWDRVADKMSIDRRVEAFVKKHVPRAAGMKEREYWDAVRKQFGGETDAFNRNYNEFWRRAKNEFASSPKMAGDPHNPESGFFRQVTDAIHRLGDRALDREYLGAVGRDIKGVASGRYRKKPDTLEEGGPLHWETVIGAAPRGPMRFGRNR